MAEEKSIDNLKHLLHDKSSVKQDVFALTFEVFNELKHVVGAISKELYDHAQGEDKRIIVSMQSEGDYEVQMTLAGDMIVFHMHTNVFTFPSNHMVHRSPYVMDDPKNAYCGIINIYNFLTDSFRFQRMNDTGYLIGRILVNRERHFFVEGKGRLGFLFNDFSTSKLDQDTLRSILVEALEHVVNFELFTPPYRSIAEVRFGDIQQLSQNLKLQTAKRLGFRFEAEEDENIEF